MAGGCSIRALWILNNQDVVVFSRRFPVVERRWRVACKSENDSSKDDNLKSAVLPLLPTDSELAAAFIDRKKRGGTSLSVAARGKGLALPHSAGLLSHPPTAGSLSQQSKSLRSYFNIIRSSVTDLPGMAFPAFSA
ncbi:hypothetical protein U1Q18_031079 [Sarracenia purpurea var. burkii]